MKIRSYPESNYRSIFFQGKTIRQKFDYTKPYLDMPHPEIEDVAINNKCAANCFVENSKVLTTDGYKNIQDIQIDDIVISYNEKTLTFEEKKFMIYLKIIIRAN